MKLYSNDLLLLLSLLTANQQFDQWRVLWGDTVESKVDVIDQTVDDETSVVDEVESRIDVLSPTLLDSSDISSGFITITSPGNYRLIEDVSTSIQIESSFVDLDLNKRIVTGALFIPSDYDYISIYNGVFMPPADTPFSDVYGTWVHSLADFVTFKELVIVCEDATANIAGRSGMWIDGDNCRIRNCMFISGSALAGGGKNGGDGINIRLSGTLHAFVENTMILTGNGGSSASGNGGDGGQGIRVNDGLYAVIKGCTILGTGNGGASSSATGGDGGNGILITAPEKVLVIDCVMKNTGTAGSGTPAGTGGFGVQDNRAAGATVKNRVIRSRAHNIAGTNFELENSGGEDGVLLTYPPDATAVNAYATVYVS